MQALTEFRRLARLLIVKDLPDRDVGWIAWQLRAIYREIPGLALTVEDVQETFDLDRDTCEIVMRALTDAGFLEPDGSSLRLAVRSGRSFRREPAFAVGVAGGVERAKAHCAAARVNRGCGLGRRTFRNPGLARL